LEPNPQAMIEDKVMPTLPLSVMNVMEGLRGTQDMVVTGESAVSEASTPLDYVVSGSQVISVAIK
ncbi:MAG TPA: SpoIVB peptidase S55, partial [Terriglobales bacterium]|nr:SpoIVB peptidase S55 [Terriglobales bacterium]